MNKSNSIRSILLYFLIIAAIVMLFLSFTGRNKKSETYTHQEFVHDLETKNVVAVDVKPNSETPTGSLIVSLKDGTVENLYVSDTASGFPYFLQ